MDEKQANYKRTDEFIQTNRQASNFANEMHEVITENSLDRHYKKQLHTLNQICAMRCKRTDVAICNKWLRVFYHKEGLQEKFARNCLMLLMYSQLKELGHLSTPFTDMRNCKRELESLLWDYEQNKETNDENVINCIVSVDDYASKCHYCMSEVVQQQQQYEQNNNQTHTETNTISNVNQMCSGPCNCGSVHCIHCEFCVDMQYTTNCKNCQDSYAAINNRFNAESNVCEHSLAKFARSRKSNKSNEFDQSARSDQSASTDDSDSVKAASSKKSNKLVISHHLSTNSDKHSYTDKTIDLTICNKPASLVDNSDNSRKFNKCNNTSKSSEKSVMRKNVDKTYCANIACSICQLRNENDELIRQIEQMCEKPESDVSSSIALKYNSFDERLESLHIKLFHNTEISNSNFQSLATSDCHQQNQCRKANKTNETMPKTIYEKEFVSKTNKRTKNQKSHNDNENENEQIYVEDAVQVNNCIAVEEHMIRHTLLEEDLKKKLWLEEQDLRIKKLGNIAILRNVYKTMYLNKLEEEDEDELYRIVMEL